MFLYNVPGSYYFDPGGFALGKWDWYFHKFDANGQDVGIEDLGGNPDNPNEYFIFEFEADGVSEALEFMEYRSYSKYWCLHLGMPYEGNLDKSEITFGVAPEPEPGGDFFVGDIPMSNAYVGHLPVIRMYLGDRKIYST